jgi:hypothetical protein
MGKAITKIFSAQDGTNLTKADLEALTYTNYGGKKVRLAENASGNMGLDILNGNASLVAMWNELSESEQKALGSYEVFVNRIKESQEKALADFEKVAAYEEEIGITIDENLTAKAAKGFAEQMDLVMRSSGKTAAQSVNTMMQDITKDLNPEKLESFYATLNGLDWTNMEDWENLPQQLEMLGISIPKE